MSNYCVSAARRPRKRTSRSFAHDLLISTNYSSVSIRTGDRRYNHACSDGARQRGFVIVIDMRGKTTWNGVKPILKVLHEHFPGQINCVYVIKPDKFWEKQKANLGTTKYKFDVRCLVFTAQLKEHFVQVQMISLEALHKTIDPAQLIRTIGGNMYYDHDEWLQTRIVLCSALILYTTHEVQAIEDVIWRAADVLRTFDSMKSDIDNAQLPVCRRVRVAFADNLPSIIRSMWTVHARP